MFEQSRPPYLLNEVMVLKRYRVQLTLREEISALLEVNYEASINGGMDKQNVYTHNEILLSL